MDEKYKIYNLADFENAKVGRVRKNALIFKGKSHGEIRIVEEFDNNIILLRQESWGDWIDRKKVYIPTRYLLTKIIDNTCVKCVAGEFGKDFVKGKKFLLQHYLHEFN